MRKDNKRTIALYMFPAILMIVVQLCSSFSNYAMNAVMILSICMKASLVGEQ